MKYLVNGINIPIGENERYTRASIAKRLNISEMSFRFEIVNRKLCLSKDGPYLSCRAIVDTTAFIRDTTVGFFKTIPELLIQPARLKDRPIIIGAGLAGLFAALILAEAGARPIVLEAGGNYSSRKEDITDFEKKNEHSSSSNYTRGLGGASGFYGGLIRSDALDSYSSYVLEKMLEKGAPSRIKKDACVSLKSEEMQSICEEISKEIIKFGGQIRYNCRFESFSKFLGKINGVNYSQGLTKQVVKGSSVLLALGRSNHSLLKKLQGQGLKLKRSDYHIGVVFEMRQKDYEAAIYGNRKYGKDLPELGLSDVFLTRDHHEVYLGQCKPNGKIFNSSNQANEVFVETGFPHSQDSQNMLMSLLMRVENGSSANHDLWSEDQSLFSSFAASFKKDLPYAAPSETVDDFLMDREPYRFGLTKTSAIKGAYLYSLPLLLPEACSSSLKEVLGEMDRKYPLFFKGDPILTGINLGKSNSVEIDFDEDGRTSLKGVYAAICSNVREENLLEEAAMGVKAALSILNEG